MGIEILRSLPADEWAEFVAKHPHGNVFHTPEMFEVFRQTKGFAPQIWATRQDGRILALFPVTVIWLIDGLLRSFSTRSVAFGSVLYTDDEEGRRGLRHLLEVYRRERGREVLFTEMRNLSDLTPAQSILNAEAFTFQDHMNYLIDLNLKEEEIFGRIGAKTRKHIRRGVSRKDVRIRTIESRDGLCEFYELLSKTYRHAGVPLSDCSLFQAALDVLGPKKMVRFSMAYVGDVPVAASADLLYKRVMYGWYGAVDRDYWKFTPNEVLTWDLLKWGSENGFHVYDFGGAGNPNEKYGVRDFKAKFGGTRVQYGRNVCVHSPAMLTVCRQAYNIARKWWPLLRGGAVQNGIRPVQ